MDSQVRVLSDERRQSLSSWPKNEAELAAVVVKYLRDFDWDVYQEVQIVSNGAIADIVATQGRLIWVVETKRSLGLSVFGQAHGWVRFAHRVSAAVPTTRDSQARRFAREVARSFGIGILEAAYRRDIYEAVAPKLRRRVDDARLRSSLTEERKTFAAAGNADGKHWSPFQATCNRVRTAVARKPGILMKELVETVEHHYASHSSARGSLTKWIETQKIKGVRIQRDGRNVRVYPA